MWKVGASTTPAAAASFRAKNVRLLNEVNLLPRGSLLCHWKSTAAAVSPSQDQHPTLIKIPSVPVFGSLLSFQSGLKVDRKDVNGSWRQWASEYGPFYSFGLPGLGKDIYGTIYVTNDPEQLHKVLKKEGSYPSGLSEGQWIFREWVKRQNYKCAGFYGRGPDWKRIRGFMQKDLLSPQSAREYIPAMIRAASKKSPHAAEWAEQNKILRYLNFCAMDLFNGIHFGTHDEMSEEDYDEFCVAAVDGLSQGVSLNRDPLTRLAMMVGVETRALKHCYANLDKVHDISQRRQKQVLDRLESGNLSDLDKESYFYKSLQRKEGSDLSLEEILEIGVIIMMASVDTTSAKTAWNVLQLAVNPEVQDRLRTEILQSVEKEGGLTPAVLELPYLKAFVRETYRCTPSAPISLSKELQSPTEIHGIELPAGTMVCLDSSVQFNPDYVEDPMVFRPERWLPEAVDARKNTPAAIIDHPFFSGPFSQGARRCPGSRVAYLEVQVMLAQLLMDWEIQLPSPMHWKDVTSSLETMVVPDFPKGTRFIPL